MNIYDSQVLSRVVASLQTPASFLLDTFFGAVQTSDQEFISFDVEERKLRITPFVAPHIAGKVVDRLGFATKTFTPAYAKDKRRFDVNRPLRRAMGEAIGGTLSPQERRNMALRLELEDQLRMLTLREEVMASEALRLGQVTVTGEGYGTQVVNYSRDGDLTVTLLTTARWGETGVDPTESLEEWAALVQGVSGAVPTDVVMDPKAWGLFRVHERVEKLLDTRRGSASAAELGPLDGRKARFVGMIGDFTIWVYQEMYVDEDGASAQVMPDHTVIMGGAEIEGTRAYGCIRDEDASYEAQRFFSKSWLEQDPAVRWLLLQSAPLVVPYRPNASLAATVR